MNNTNMTLEYYNRNAADFTAGTLNVDFQENQNRFLKMLNRGDLILDFGCGSGRDTKYFLEHGMRVEAIDGSIELCRIASGYTGKEICFFRIWMSVNDMTPYGHVHQSCICLKKN